ncbi:hypothetical protein P691DRAFT_764545 [Macrolepiota fuliginosa MF-IS2]|uniref:Uncharacterized protein n=1 Tax=Macrolepiota fuliginosa MF-IS2 TaxID=1400762 RepID=A0A9P5X1M1_9AGAR|nr:hypothetical protein P691DRAFT_764545 [Macrolepiota fuliginosa MF-IS2]
MSTQQPGSKSLYDLFPHLEAATLIKIACHEFKPADLYKLDARYHDKTELECLQDSASRTGSWKDYPTINSLVIPLQMYFCILTWFAANEGDVELTATIATGGLEYIGHILLLSQRYEWHAVVQYHSHFHLAQQCEMAQGNFLNWHCSDPDLMSEYLMNNVKQRPAKKTTGPTRANQTCFLFNKGECMANPCPNGRAHKC